MWLLLSLIPSAAFIGLGRYRGLWFSVVKVLWLGLFWTYVLAAVVSPPPPGWTWVFLPGAVLAAAVSLSRKRGRFRPDLARRVYTVPAAIRYFLSGVLWTPISEELYYRAIVQCLLAPAVGTWPAALIAAVLFCLGHSDIKRAYAGVVGAATAAVYAWTGSLWPALAIHVLVNMADFLHFYLTCWRHLSCGARTVDSADGLQHVSHDH